MICRVTKFKRITIALLTFSGIYVLFMIYKLGSNFDKLRIFTAPKSLGGTFVHWRQPYWLIDDDMVDNDYQILFDSVVDNGDDENGGVRVYPYKGIKSEILSIRRTLKDTRPFECKLQTYSYELMPVTIVVVFHNEYTGVILRSLYSIVTNTPKELINEIIYVDDASTNNYLEDEFEMYIEKTRAIIKNIHVIKLKKRLGANRAILEAVKISNSDYLVLMTQLLDVNKNWLPPLLNTLMRNEQTIAVPVHEYKHWKPNGSVVLNKRGLFDLELKYVEVPRLKEGPDYSNFRSPFLPPRGLFVINKAFLHKINGHNRPVGGQDGNFIELSFKAWTCGGRIIKVPCSRVSHNFRESGLHDAFVLDSKLLDYELKSTIENFFDEFKDIFLNISSSRFVNISSTNSPNDVQDENNNKCKSFKWFITKIAPDLRINFLVQPKVVLTGKLQNVGGENLCLQQKTKTAEFISLDECTKRLEHDEKLNFDMTRQSDIRAEGTFFCWEAYNEVNYKNTSARFVATQPCNAVVRNQKFIYLNMDEHIHHLESDTCLEAIEKSKYVWLTECDLDKDTQKWKLI